MKSKVYIPILIVAALGLIFIKTKTREWMSVDETPARRSGIAPPARSGVATPPIPANAEAAVFPDASGPSPSADSIELLSNNFESFVSRCFQGEPCRFGEDPRAMYEAFKHAGNRKATDALISFLRSRMKDPVDRSTYKEALKMMIDDFYPPEEKPFQEAAYYNYLGELEKSLELYLALEKRSLNDLSLRSAPKLNIANTYFDLKRYSEAAAYYRAARAEFESGKSQSLIPGSNEMLGFIDERLRFIQER